ncbi:MAG: extracellular solute-binding protein [Rhodospirillaceae bacterium]|nr:MAG: extracellular solute-binding protein [Rhodospirillaceae bacterium]
MKKRDVTHPTAVSARAFSRRRLLKTTATLGAAAVTAPWLVRDAFSSSGELNFIGWAGYDFKPAFEAFEKKTGIKINFNEQPDQDAMAAQAKAGGSDTFDISEPTADRVRNWVEQGFIQPWDTAKINLDGVEPGIMNGSAAKQGEVDGKLYASPSVWGTESLMFNTDEVKLEYPQASLGDLWQDQYAGKVALRANSGLMAIGRWLETEGKLPKPYDDSFKDEATMVANYDVILKKAQELKGHIAQWWKDENSAQGAFRTNGCVIGHCWDTSAQALQKEGLPIGYISPKEGAAAWLQEFVLFKKAKNVAQAEAWISWINSPEGSLAWAVAWSGNPVAKGGADAAPESQKKFLKAAFPGDALNKLWWWPEQTTWFVSKRNEYIDRFQSA